MDEKKREEYVERLMTNKLLTGLGSTQLKQFLASAEEEIWPRHTCSVTRPSTTRHFHFVISGRVKVFKIDPESTREITLFILGKDQVFDLLYLLDGMTHPVWYETLDKVVLLVVPMSTMKQWVLTSAEINRNILPYLSHQMRMVEEYAASVALADISTRLARLILSHINAESRELELINDLSNDEIASLIGSTRAVVNRHLQYFKNEGILNLGRRRIEINNLELLLAKAQMKKS